MRAQLVSALSVADHHAGVTQAQLLMTAQVARDKPEQQPRLRRSSLAWAQKLESKTMGVVTGRMGG